MIKQETFWSRRRKAAEAESRHDAAVRTAAAEARAQAEQEAKSDEVLLQELDLPDPDSLLPGDDFSVFMDKTVPPRLRNRALRILWRSNPVLANLDDLVDYADDFTDTGQTDKAIHTAYQVGKGMLKHTDHLTRQDARQADLFDQETEAQEEPPEELEPAVATEDASADKSDADTTEVAIASRPRRMRFVAVETTEEGDRNAG